MFLDPSELSTHIYGEIIDTVTQGDETIMPQAIAAAIIESQGYLDRFDINDLFGKTATDRDPFLLLSLKNMAKWHFILLANPNIDYEDTERRYKQALQWLEKVQASKVTPVGWKLKDDPILSSEFKVDSNQVKRTNHY